MTAVRRATTRRGLHPLAWWIWAAALAGGAMRMTWAALGSGVLLGPPCAGVAGLGAGGAVVASWVLFFVFVVFLGLLFLLLGLVFALFWGAFLLGFFFFTLKVIRLFLHFFIIS